MTTDELKALLAPVEGADAQSTITALKAKHSVPDISDYQKQYLVGMHRVMDKGERPDKVVSADNGETRIEKVNRIGIAMQELIAERAVSFLFGSPVVLACEPSGEKQATVLQAITRILKDNKINSFNQEIALEMFTSTEVAECWFPVTKETHQDYGFQTDKKLRVMSFNPSLGNELYPLFDPTGDLIAFSRQFTLSTENGVTTTYFETYTDELKIIWKQVTGGWAESLREPNPIKKIPVVYGRQKSVEWANVQNLIERLEWLLSNYADTDDYHASPTVFTVGEIISMPKKGESGKIIQGKKDAKAEYLSWNQAPEMVRLEIETLFKLIYSISQTPDISFETMKGVGQISGVALKMLFLDAHLKVKKKQRVFDAYLERRINILKAYVGLMNTTLKADASAIHIENHIEPFMIDDETAKVERLTAANGNNPLISQKTAIKLSGLVDDVDKEYEDIRAETERANSFDVLQPNA